MQEALERELNDAKSIEDQARRHEATEMVQSHMLVALIDCQRKTAERVKSVKSTVEDVQVDVTHIKAEMRPLKASHDLYMAECEQRKGAMWATRLMWVIVSACASVGAFILGKAM